MGARHRLAREERLRRRLGSNPKCRRCGETTLAALSRKRDGLYCYECIARARSASTVEDQHPTGRDNDPDLIVGVPGNLHRVLDFMKDSWPREVRQNPDADPLLRCVQRALAQRDWSEVGLRQWQAVADWLQRLQVRLREKHGDRWWEALGLPPFPGGE